MQATGEPSTTIATVIVKLPPFWPADPALWFAHIESLFATLSITRQETKFHYMVSVLQPSEAGEVRDVIMNPPTEHLYDRIKKDLIKRTMASEQRRLQQLFTTEELGYRRPSQLLRSMRQLFEDRATTFDDAILRVLFLQRLPNIMQA